MYTYIKKNSKIIMDIKNKMLVGKKKLQHWQSFNQSDVIEKSRTEAAYEQKENETMKKWMKEVIVV